LFDTRFRKAPLVPGSRTSRLVTVDMPSPANVALCVDYFWVADQPVVHVASVSPIERSETIGAGGQPFFQTTSQDREREGG